ncbi:hypothetical protein Tco_0187927 [Tanacetum coccineum]
MGMKATPTPTKKSSITAEEHILFDSDEALKLGESMSLNEVEIGKEERGVHETHSSLVIGKMQVSKVDKEAIERSSEGSGIKPEVPNELKGKSKGSSEGADEEEVILSSDDEETKSEKEAAKSEKAYEEEVQCR